jgi:hypothetical protein
MVVLAAQAHHDPLSAAEADQVREASDDPAKRLKLFTDFARQRLANFEEIRKGNAPDRSSKLYQLLEEYEDIVKEMDDNLDSYMSGHVTGEMQIKPKLRQPVQLTIQADQQFLADLKRIQQASSSSDLQSYQDQLGDCISSTQDSLKAAQDDLAEIGKREQREKEEKELKKKREKEEKEQRKLDQKRELSFVADTDVSRAA